MNSTYDSNDLTRDLASCFPFKPYNIQLDFARKLFTELTNKKLCFFESPTGTGKTLSLICGSLKWLEDNINNFDLLYNSNNTIQFGNNANESNTTANDDDLPDWINNLSENKKKNFIQAQKLKRDRLKNHEDIKNKLRKANKLKLKEINEKNNNDPDRKFIIDYDSDNDKDTDFDGNRVFSKKIKRNNDEYDHENVNDDVNDDFKVIYTTRTHTQLKQFIDEIKKTKFKYMRIINMASRSNLCINNDVLNLSKPEDINQKCKKLINGAKTSSKESKTPAGCEFYDTTKMLELSISLNEEPRNIEEMLVIGKKNKACPYYSSKSCAKNSHIICVPYASVFHNSTREMLNIPIKNSIIIVDECHNFMENLNEIFSSTLDYISLTKCYSQLKGYSDKFKSRLKAKNYLYITQLSEICYKIMTFIKSKYQHYYHQQQEQENQPNINMSFNEIQYDKLKILDFLLKVNLDKYDYFKLQKFIIQRYGEKLQEQQNLKPQQQQEFQSQPQSQTPLVNVNIKDRSHSPLINNNKIKDQRQSVVNIKIKGQSQTTLVNNNKITDQSQSPIIINKSKDQAQSILVNINKAKDQQTELVNLATLDKFIEFLMLLIECDDTNAILILNYEPIISLLMRSPSPFQIISLSSSFLSVFLSPL